MRLITECPQHTQNWNRPRELLTLDLGNNYDRKTLTLG